MRKALAILLILLVGVLTYVNSQKEVMKKPLVIATNVFPGYEVLYLSRDLEFVSDKDITFMECSSASEVMQAFSNELADVVALTLDEFLSLREKVGDEAVVALVLDNSNGADCIVANPEIKTIKGLKGKRVGYENTALGAYVLHRALEAEGLNMKDVTGVPLLVSQHEMAFEKKQIDAAVTFDPYSNRLKKLGGNVIFDSTMIPGEILDVLVVRKSLVIQKDQRLDSLIQGWFKSLNSIDESLLMCASLMAPRLQIQPSEVVEALELLKLHDIKSNRDLLKTNKINDLMEKMKKFLIEKNIVEDVSLNDASTDLYLGAP